MKPVESWQEYISGRVTRYDTYRRVSGDRGITTTTPGDRSLSPDIWTCLRKITSSRSLTIQFYKVDVSFDSYFSLYDLQSYIPYISKVPFIQLITVSIW